METQVVILERPPQQASEAFSPFGIPSPSAS